MCHWHYIDPANEKTWPPDSGEEVDEAILVGEVWHYRILTARVVRSLTANPPGPNWYWKSHVPPFFPGRENKPIDLLDQSNDPPCFFCGRPPSFVAYGRHHELLFSGCHLHNSREWQQKWVEANPRSLLK